MATVADIQLLVDQVNDATKAIELARQERIKNAEIEGRELAYFIKSTINEWNIKEVRAEEEPPDEPEYREIIVRAYFIYPNRRQLLETWTVSLNPLSDNEKREVVTEEGIMDKIAKALKGRIPKPVVEK